MPFDSYVLSVVEVLYDVLDRSPAAVVLLDEHRRVVYANERAAGLHAQKDGIALSMAGVSLTRKQDDSRLRALVARALGTSGSPGNAMRALRPSGKRPYAIFVAPVSRRSASSQSPVVCVVITDADTREELPLDRLRGIFDLTDAESRLAALLAGGEDLKSAAQALGITYGTARARLAEIFQKTETRRQGELVNLLLTTLAAV